MIVNNYDVVSNALNHRPLYKMLVICWNIGVTETILQNVWFCLVLIDTAKILSGDREMQIKSVK